MVEPLRHRQSKEAATDMFSLQPPRHISTLPFATNRGATILWSLLYLGHNGHRAALAPEGSVVIDPNVWSGRA